MKEQTIKDPPMCHTCGEQPALLCMKRGHIKSDLYRENMKLKIKGEVMKKVITYHFCDVCGRREVSDSYKPNDWEEINYKSSWNSGCHSGHLEKKFLACESCLKENSKKLFKKLLGYFKAQ
jgi:hypothetical protein